MRQRPVLAAATVVAVLSLLVASAGTVLAGGWADVKPDAGTLDQPPVEGLPTEIGFTILQHGETPAGWVTPTVRLTDLASGETIEVGAPPGDDQGHFAVSITLPTAGLWSWTVTFPELASDGRIFPLTVRHADGSMPEIDPGIALALVEQAKRDVSGQINDAVSAEIERIDSNLSLRESYDERHTKLLGELTAERDDLAQRVEALEAGGIGGGSSIAITALLAILAGATAGFAMAWLAGRPRTRELEVSPARTPHGSPTA